MAKPKDQQLKPKAEKTSPKVASKAGKLLPQPNTTKAVRAVAGSALTQAANKPATKKSNKK